MEETGNIASLAGHVAVVTGAGRGIGAAISAKLASLGAAVALCGRTQKPLESTANAISKSGGRADVLQCDVTDLRSVEAVAAHVDRTLGRLDILVNNAGVGGFGGPLHQLPPESWDQVLNTNLRGVYYCIRAFARLCISYSRRTLRKLVAPVFSLTFRSSRHTRGVHGTNVAWIRPGYLLTDRSDRFGRPERQERDFDSRVCPR